MENKNFLSDEVLGNLPQTHKYIYDESIEPLFIGIDTTNSSYILYSSKMRTSKTTQEKKQGVEVLGYYSSLSGVLRSVAKELVHVKGPNKFNSIREYIRAWEDIKEKMEGLVSI
jgi:hypothetical protein